YLEPLKRRIAEHNGSVYGDGQTVYLLIDLKLDGVTEYPVLRSLLEQYKDMLTRYGQPKTPGPITVILTGNQPPRKTLIDEPERLVASDGSLKDLKTNLSPDLVPMISGQWGKTFSWDGVGKISTQEQARLAEIV